ncbi:MAG: DUF1700 domain-containing protein [Defluviitaleaceae bacterium]|nr:DUF1700 domain-containing protein [Defluviitaleaceae bacterium]
MTKAEYLEQLDYKLRVLPYSERQDALDYYDGYISDSGSEGNAIAQLGTPGEVAAVILANFVANESPAGTGMPAYVPLRKNGFKTAWMIILALFAVPVGFPLLIAVGATAFALFVALVAVIFALGVSGISVLVAGVVSLFTLPFIVVQDLGFGLVSAGMALVGMGIGILLIGVAVRSMGGFMWIARFVGRKITRRSEYHGRPKV